MKFVVVVVLFALALGAQSSVVPITLVGGPGPVLLTTGPHPAAASVAVHAAVHPVGPLVVASPVVAAPAVVAVAPAEGTYVAQTRGAVHVAPLPGHSQSATSVNLEPAPGTH